MSRLSPHLWSVVVALSLVSAGCFQDPDFGGPYRCLDDGSCGDDDLVCDDGICCRPGGNPVCPTYVNEDGSCPGGGQPTNFYQDLDGDGFGNDDAARPYCIPPVTDGFVAQGGDCNDNPGAGGAATFPNATEQCDGLDNNCNGDVDEGHPRDDYFRDQDGDGFGDPARRVPACRQPTGYVLNDTDCEPTNPAANPNGVELCNLLDDDCDLVIDDVPQAGESCSDPGRQGICAPGVRACEGGTMVCSQTVFSQSETCDGVDQDCDGTPDDGLPVSRYYRDQDADGYGDPGQFVDACSMPSGYVANAQDCGPSNFDVKPGASEQCNNVDDNCAGGIDETAPLNGNACTDPNRKGVCQPGIQRCAAGAYVCDPTVFPAARDHCDSLDNDCDGPVDEQPDCGGPRVFLDDPNVRYGSKHLEALLWGSASACVKGDPADPVGPADTINSVVPTSGSDLIWRGSEYESHVFWAEAINGTWDLSKANTKLWLRVEESITSTNTTYKWANINQPVVMLCDSAGGHSRLVKTGNSTQPTNWGTPLFPHGDDYVADVSNYVFVDGGNGWVIGSGSTPADLTRIKRIEIIVQPESASPAASFEIDFYDASFGFPP